MSVLKNNPNDFPLYLFYQGKNYEAWKFFGVHSRKKGRGIFHTFRVWAPNGIIDKRTEYDDYITDERVAAARERIY